MSSLTAPTLLTGSPRSGTTLLTRLLGSIEGIVAYSQPLPLVLVDLKSAFLRERGAPPTHVRYPLADQQFEHAYPPEEFAAFLSGRPLSTRDIQTWMTSMAGYSGQYHRPTALEEVLATWHGGDLLDLVRSYADAHDAGGRRVVWKETFAEEFAPYVLDRDGHLVLLLRDVRDMVVSHVAGGASEHAGRPRPLLFLARQWRRTVAHALALGHRRDVAVVRFEDLLLEPSATLATLLTKLFVGVDPPGEVALDWAGNSSFSAHDGLSRSPIGRHKDHLADQDRRFLEALCHAEMHAIGYEPSIAAEDVLDCLAAGPGTDYLERPELAHYRYDGARRDEEVDRRRALLERRWDPSMFIYLDAFHALGRAT